MGISGSTAPNPRRVLLWMRVEERLTFDEAWERGNTDATFRKLRGGAIHIRPRRGAAGLRSPDCYEHIPGAPHEDDWSNDVRGNRDVFLVGDSTSWLASTNGPEVTPELIHCLRAGITWKGEATIENPLTKNARGNIEILCANSSQAKGRVERANRTLQDRLVKELRLAGVSDMAAGNMFLPRFVKQFNEKFSVPAEKTENLHRKFNVQAARLADILCHREQRHVGQQLTLPCDRRQIILERSDLADGLAGQYVEIYDFADRPPEVRWKGHSLPCRVFSKDQRVSHTAIVENKRLSHALAMVKAQQDIKHLPTVMTNSTKNGYKKRPRQIHGPDYKETIAALAVEMTA
jgi:hypothetical protein